MDSTPKSNTPLFSKLSKMMERIRPTTNDVEQKVEFNVKDSVFQYYVDDVVNNFEMRIDPTEPFDRTEVRKHLEAYLIVLLGMRIDYVNRLQVAIKPAEPIFAIPGTFSLALEQVGRVDVSNRLGFILMPELTVRDYWKDAFKLCPPASLSIPKEQERMNDKGELEKFKLTEVETRQRWLECMARKMRRLFSKAHITDFSDCMPVSKCGTLDFMCMHIVNSEILGPSAEIHPVYALCAAILGVHQVGGVYERNVMPYMTFAQCRTCVVEAANLEGGVCDDRRHS